MPRLANAAQRCKRADGAVPAIGRDAADQTTFRREKAKLRGAIIHDTGLSPAARLVGYEIADNLNPKSGDAWPSQEYIAGRLGIEVRSVRRAVAQLLRAGWFTAEMDGRSWRYIPCFARLDLEPDKLSAIDTGQMLRRHRTNTTAIPDTDVPLSSRENLREPTIACGKAQPRDGDEADERRSGEGTKQPIIFADRDQEITDLARSGGAPAFVFEGSEPWRAWCEYRTRNGVPGSLPTRQHMVGGRWRTGWDAPTLWPPGYGRRRA